MPDEYVEKKFSCHDIRHFRAMEIWHHVVSHGPRRNMFRAEGIRLFFGAAALYHVEEGTPSQSELIPSSTNISILELSAIPIFVAQ